jgi:hypothetical protein
MLTYIRSCELDRNRSDTADLRTSDREKNVPRLNARSSSLGIVWWFDESNLFIAYTIHLNVK